LPFLVGGSDEYPFERRQVDLAQERLGKLGLEHDRRPILRRDIGDAAIDPAVGVFPIARRAVPEHRAITLLQRIGLGRLAEQMRADQAAFDLRYPASQPGGTARFLASAASVSAEPVFRPASSALR
jgi:hypothetical protein